MEDGTLLILFSWALCSVVFLFVDHEKEARLRKIKGVWWEKMVIVAVTGFMYAFVGICTLTLIALPFAIVFGIFIHG